MSLKPVLTQTATQNTSVAGQINKPMHPQGHSAAYGQPPHIPQNLVSNLSHNQATPAHNSGHNMPHHLSTHNNHYSLTVPNATQHYSNSASTPAHAPPMTNAHMGTNNAQSISPPKNHSLPSTLSQSHLPQPNESSTDKQQSNGTEEVKSDQNHVVSKEKPEKPAQVPTLPSVAPDSIKQTEAPQDEGASTSADVPKEEATIPVKEGTTKPEIASASEKLDNCEVPDAVEKKEETLDEKNDSVENKESIDEKVLETEKSKTTNSETANSETSNTEMKEEECEEKPTESISSDKMPSTPSKNSPAKSTSSVTPTRTSRKAKVTPKTDLETPKSLKRERSLTSTPATQKTPADNKSKRQRTMTQYYQSPLPEIELITKIAKSNTNKSKSTDEKLIIFYKNEFLAVRNAENGFYICQTVQNIYKSSLKIKIRWLSQDKEDKTGEIYTPDFYDVTDFDCILTNLNLERVNKGQYRLPPEEKVRTDNILKRALAVENGEEEASLTEEHPDGLDVSLYKEESQLKKKKGTKRKSSSPLKAAGKSNEKSPDKSKVRKMIAKSSKKNTMKTTAKTSVVTSKKGSKPAATGNRTERAKRRQENIKTSPVVDAKKAKVLAKVARKTAISSSSKTISKPAIKPTKTTSTNSKEVKAAVQPTRKTKRVTRK